MHALWSSRCHWVGFQFCEQVCGLAICTMPTSGSELKETLLQTNQEKIKPWLSLHGGRGWKGLGRAHFIFFLSIWVRSLHFYRKVPPTVLFYVQSSTSRATGISRPRNAHILSLWQNSLRIWVFKQCHMYKFHCLSLFSYLHLTPSWLSSFVPHFIYQIFIIGEWKYTAGRIESLHFDCFKHNAWWGIKSLVMAVEWDRLMDKNKNKLENHNFYT